jgi:DNA-binding MarR family transcriptional regulator
MLTKQEIGASRSPLRTWDALLRVGSVLTAELGSPLLESYGLTLHDYEALDTLAHRERGAMRRVDLAAALRVTPSGITRLLEGLEARGLVEKLACPQDLRVTYASITGAGRELLAEASRTHQEAVREVLGRNLSCQELDQLSGLLDRLAASPER